MKISVVIPLYNKKETIIRAVESVFNQTFIPLEIIIVNDGSTDGSENVVKSLRNPLLKLISQPNRGVSSARNTGIKEAKGDWIAFLDADDVWMSEYLETIQLLLRKYPGCQVLATAYMLQECTSIRKNITLRGLPFEGEDGILTDYFKVASSSHPPLWTSAIVVERSAILLVGGFPEGITSGEDLLTWAKLASIFSIAYSLKPQSVFVSDGKSICRLPQFPDLVSSQFDDSFSFLGAQALQFKKYRSLWHKMRVVGYLEHGRRVKAFHEIMLSVKFNLLTNAWLFVPFVFFKPSVFKKVSKWYRNK